VYRLTRIQERNKDGALTGYFVDFSYNDTTGRLLEATSSDGRSVSYTHDEVDGLTSGNLIEVNGLENIVQSFAYTDTNDEHNVSSIQTSADATPVINIYDNQDRVVQQDYGNHTTVFDYVIDRGKTVVNETIRDAQGLNPYTISSTYEFDTAGNYTNKIDALGNEVRHVFDANRDRIRTEWWQNNAGTLALLQAKDFSYDGMGRKLTESVTLGSGETITTSWTYEQGWVASEQTVSSTAPAKIFRTEFTFVRDANNVPINLASSKRRHADGSFQVSSYSYDTLGRLIATTLPDGVQVFNEYTGAYLTRTWFKDSSGTDIATNQRTFTYNNQGNRITSTDARGNTSTYEFDDQSRIIKQTNPLGEQTIYTYTNNNLTQIEVGRTVAEGAGQLSQFIYDGKDRQIEIKRQDDNGVWQSYQSFSYDSRNQLLSQTDALGRATSYNYDPEGRMTSVTDPANNSTQFDYDARSNRIEMTDALGRVTTYSYDALNRLLEENQQSLNAITKYSYDAASNLTSVTDPESQRTNYSYDTLSRRTQETRPLGQSLNYFYDNRDRITYMLNARNQRINYSYADWGGLLSQSHYLDDQATNLERIISHNYDLDGNLVSSNDDSIQAGDLYSLNYDALSRPLTQTIKYIPGGDKTLTYSYDRFGNRSSMSLNDGQLLSHSYSFDKRNRLIQANLPQATGSQSINLSYTEADERQQITYPNGVTTSYTFEPNGPIKTINTQTSTNTNLESWTYNYNAVLNIDAISNSLGQTTYSYDGLNRLTSADYPSLLNDETYAYDLVGNREDPNNTAAYDYDQNNRILQSPINGNTNYSFDSDGNLTQSTSSANNKTYSYDISNRLRTYTGTSNSAIYSYDPNGRRINKTVNGATSTYFLWDGTQILAEYNGAGIRTQRYAYLPGDYAPSQSADENGIYNVHSDHLQTPKLMTNSSQDIVWTNHMQAFGESNIDADPDGDSNIVIMNIRFPGQYEDSEKQLFYNMSREYDFLTGRYNEADPIEGFRIVDYYSYADNNPNMFIDPMGLRFRGFKLPIGTGTIISGTAVQFCTNEAFREWKLVEQRLDKKRDLNKDRKYCPKEEECYVMCLYGKFIPGAVFCNQSIKIRFHTQPSCPSDGAPAINIRIKGIRETCFSGKV
ncbi:MAG: hypothetical protein L3J24_14710, partial [Xanthomonadales bacterium]|nr:hypothetical protein [Xanthomonadales bacterium]